MAAMFFKHDPGAPGALTDWWPQDVKYIDVDSCRVAHVDMGSGEAIVFLHGISAAFRVMFPKHRDLAGYHARNYTSEVEGPEYPLHLRSFMRGSGHSPMMDRPDRFNREVKDFLTRHPAKT